MSAVSKTDRNYFEALPDEMICQIVVRIDPGELHKVGQICQRFQNLMNDEVLWRSLLTQHWNVPKFYVVPSGSRLETIGSLASGLAQWRAGYLPINVVATIVSTLLCPKTAHSEIAHACVVSASPWIKRWIDQLLPGEAGKIPREPCVESAGFIRPLWRAALVWRVSAPKLSEKTLKLIAEVIGASSEEYSIYTAFIFRKKLEEQKIPMKNYNKIILRRIEAQKAPGAVGWLLAEYEYTGGSKGYNRSILNLWAQLAEYDYEKEAITEIAQIWLRIWTHTSDRDKKKTVANQLVRFLAGQKEDIENKKQILTQLFSVHSSYLGFARELPYIIHSAIRYELRAFYHSLLVRSQKIDWEERLWNHKTRTMKASLKAYLIAEINLSLVTRNFEWAAKKWVLLWRWENGTKETFDYLYKLIKAAPTLAQEIEDYPGGPDDSILANMYAYAHYCKMNHLYSQHLLSKHIGELPLEKMDWFREYADEHINAALIYSMHLVEAYDEFESFLDEILPLYPDECFYFYYNLAVRYLFWERFERFDEYFDLAEQELVGENLALKKLSELAAWVEEEGGDIETEKISDYLLLVE